ncbi:hypothetical protein [Actinoplanes sp. NPDC048796]|uniref:hypothetical protein n=1 Tax=unclassified Actinoplanes TaxID=2626549 RepID=UPI0033EBDBB9
MNLAAISSSRFYGPEPSNRAIVDQLLISARPVVTYLSRVYCKTGIEAGINGVPDPPQRRPEHSQP